MTDQLFVTIAGCEVELVPTLKATKALSNKYQGLIPLIEIINIGSLEAATDVVFFALGKEDRERDGVREQVYNAGLDYLAPYLVRFVIGCANGGRIPPAKSEPVAAND